MRKYVALHDRRMKGGVPARPDLGVVNLDEETPITNAFAAINGWARPRIHTVFVLCHGKAGYEDEVRLVSRLRGGGGLTLGREKVVLSNVHLWRAIRGKVENIVVYSCRAAMTDPCDAGTMYDGRYLMGALAVHTQAVVYASDGIQRYGRWHDLLHGRMDIRDWVGRLYRFLPSGAPPREVKREPVDFRDLMGRR
jgi:hypothetical protein